MDSHLNSPFERTVEPRRVPEGLHLHPAVLVQAFKSLSQGVWIGGKDGRLVYVNEAFQAMTGYSAQEIIGQNCDCLQGVDSDPLAIAAIRVALDAGTAFSGEILNYTKSGVPFWNELTIDPLRDTAGAVTHYVAIMRDVTERKNTEAELRNAEQRYRLMFDHSQAGIVLHGSDTAIVYANSMAAKLLGMDLDHMLRAKSTAPIWHFLREDGSPMSPADYPVNRILSERREIVSLVAGIRHGSDDRITWVMCSAYPIRNRHGQLNQVIVSFTDVTELKQTARALEKSEERLRLVLRGANDAAWDFDIGSDEYHYSFRWWQMLGYADQALPSDAQLWKRLIHPTDLPLVDKLITGAVNEESSDFELEIRMQHRDGHYVPMLSRGFILRDEAGRPVRISGTNTVITERKRAEDALRQSEAVLRAFVEASPFPAILSDIHGTFLYINPACVNTFGYALTDVPTMRAWRARAHPDLRYRRWVGSTWSKRLERARQSGRPFDPFEVIVRCKDGTERTVLASTVDLPGEATVSQSFVLIDVTEQRRLERGIIQAANREQSRLGMDLHDGLGQELTGLSLSLSGLSRRVRTGDAQVIEAELCSLTALAAQCIATTRAIAHGLSPLEPGCEGLRRALLRLCERGHIGDMQLKLNLVGLASRPLDHAPLDQAVGDSIYRIVQEALANAAKHSGATCTSIEAHRGRSSLTVSVRDNGRGMPAHIGSEGLGLRIMRYRAHAVGGHLDIESSPLTGTHVKCRFPLPH